MGGVEKEYFPRIGEGEEWLDSLGGIRDGVRDSLEKHVKKIRH
jgi:hypothetical protein